MFNSFPLIMFLSLFRCLQYPLIFIMVAILSTNQRMCTKVKCQIGFVTLTIGVFLILKNMLANWGTRITLACGMRLVVLKSAYKMILELMK